MKIISYNIADCKQWKIDRLLKLNADVFVVPEITCIEQAVIPDDLEMAWNGITWEFAGKRKWKGLGLIWKKGHGHIAPWYNPELYYAIPVFIDGILILGFWPTKRRGLTDKKKYPQIAQEIIKEYAPYLSQQPTVVIGDFNCFVDQNDWTKEYGDIRQVNEMVEQCGLQSVYHNQTGESLGQETRPTYYHMFKLDHPFMLDYAYTNAEVKSFRVLDIDLEMSDHVGLELQI